MMADSHDHINNIQVVELFLRKQANAKSLADMGGLPKDWLNFQRSDFEKLVRNIDLLDNGCVNYRRLATYCILLQSPLPNEDQL